MGELLRVGDPAPDFTLAATTGEDVTLGDHRGKSNVLLAFFPLAFTGVCTAEMCDFSAGLPEFQDVGTVVLGVSVDAVPSLLAFREREGITIDLLSDIRREVCRAYGTLMEESFFSRRAYFIIDRGGTIRWIHVERELGDRRDNEELLAELAKLSA